MSETLERDDPYAAPENQWETPDPAEAPAYEPAPEPAYAPPRQAIRPQTQQRRQALPTPPRERPTVAADAPDLALPPPVAPPGKLKTLKDVGDQAWNAMLGAGADAIGLAAFATKKITGDPNGAKFLDEQRADVQRHIDLTTEGMSELGQQAQKSSVFNEGGADAPNIGDVGVTRYVAATAASFLPDLVMAIMGPAGGAKVALKLATMAKAGKPALETAAKVGAHVGTGVGFGTLDAGRAWNTISDEIEKASPEDMAKNPAYQALRDQGMDDHDAKSHLLAQPAVAASVMAHFAVGGTLGAAGGAILRTGAFGGAARGKLANAALGAAEGAGLMGGQAGVEDVIDQGTRMKVGMQKGFDTMQTAKAVAGGVLGGGLMGGVAGTFHAKPKVAGVVADSKAKASPGVPGDVGQALAEHLGTTEKLPDLEPPPAAPGPPVDPAVTADVMNPPGSRPEPKVGEVATTAEIPPGLTETPPVLAETPPVQAQVAEQVQPPVAPPVAPVAAKPITASQVQRRDKVGINEARRRADRENAAQAGPVDTTVVNTKSVVPSDAPVPAPQGVLTSPEEARPASPLAEPPVPPVVESAGSAPAPAPRVAPAPEPKIEPASKAMDEAVDRVSPAPTPAPALALPPEAPPAPAKILTKGEQIKADAAAKRALAKAKLAKPGERVVGQAAVMAEGADVAAAAAKPTTVEPAKPEAPKAPERAPHEIAASITEAAGRAARSESLPPSVVEGWVREVARVMQGAGSEAEAHTALRDWGAKDVPVAGSKIRRAVVADKMMALLTGKGLPERERLAQEARSESKSQPAVHESAGMAREADLTEQSSRSQDIARDTARDEKRTEDATDAGGLTVTEATAHPAEESSKGLVQDVSAGGEKVRKQTTNKDRVLKDLEQKVRNGEMTLAEAEVKYGPDNTGKGAKRKVTSVEAHIRERIRTEQDPTTVAHLKDALARHEDPIGQALVEQPKVAVQTVGDELQIKNHIKKIETGKDAGALLSAIYEAREMRGKVTDARELDRRTDEINANHGVTEAQIATMENKLGRVPDKHARAIEAELLRRYGPDAERAEPHYRRAKPDGIAPESSSFVEAANDPKVNNFIPEAMAAHERAGMAYTLHDALNMVLSNPAVRAVMRPYHELAKIILKHGADIPVMSQERAMDEGRITPGQKRAFDGSPKQSSVLGMFQGSRTAGDGFIVLNPEGAGMHVQTLLHEGLHSVTSRHIDNLIKNNPGHPDLQALDAIAAELRRHARAEGESLSPKSRDDIDYALKDHHELHTMLMSNPEVQAFAARMVASPALRGELARLGMQPREAGRSVWRAFTDWTRKALGLEKPATASEHTMLDHVMRPVQDILNRAVEHNERALTRDPVLRETAEPLMRTMTASMGEAGEKLRDVLHQRPNMAAAGHAARSKILAVTNLDQIVTRYKDLFDRVQNMAFGNPLTHARDAGEKIAARSHEFGKEFGERASKLVAAARALAPAEYRTLGRLMNEATIATARLSSTDPDANVHMNSARAKATLADLQSRYAQLTPEAKAVHAEVIKFHAETERVKVKAQLSGALARGFPEATPEQRDIFSRTGTSKVGFEAFLADPDNSAIAASFGTGWSKQRQLTMAIAEIVQQGKVKGDYTPLARYGDYVVQYGEKGTPNYGFEMFEKLGDAQARRAELMQDPDLDVHHVDLKKPAGLTEITKSNPLIQSLNEAIGRRPDLAEHADDLREMMAKLVLQSSRNADTSKMQRQGITGASHDFARTLARDFVNDSQQIGYMEHGGERHTALARMDLMADDLARNGHDNEAIIARQVTAELRLKVRGQENAGGVLAGASRVASTFAYTQSLASFSHIVVNTLSAHMVAMPMLSGRHGIGRATLAMTKAMIDVTPTMVKAGALNTMKALGKGLQAADWDLSRAAKERLIAKGANASHMNALFKAFDGAGLIDHSETRELRRIAKGGGSGVSSTVGRRFDQFLDFMGAANHSFDVLNKSAIGKAAFDLEMRRSKGDVNASIEHAMNMVRDTTPNFNLANTNRFSTSAGPLGGAAGPLTQFKRYGFHMYGMLGNLVKQSFKGASKEERREAQKQFAGVLATHALMAGSLTLVADPLRYIGGLYDWVVGTAKPHTYQNDVRAWMADTFGPEIGEIMARGLPHALGIDLHNRVGLHDMLAIPGLESFDAKGFQKMVATALSGASGENATQALGGLSKLRSGDIEGGVMALVPRPIRDVMKAYKLSNKGVTDPSGKTILAADKLSPWDIGMQAAGFQPSRVSEFREKRWAVQQTLAEIKDERGKLQGAWLKNAADPAARAEVMSRIQEFNHDPANRGQGITMSQLMQQLHAQRKQEHQPDNRYGLKLPKKAANTLTAAGAF